MPSTKKSEKVTVTHPVTGTQRKFDADVYERVKAAILQTLKGSGGMSFTELSDSVVAIIQKQRLPFKGSIPWYTISIKLDLETRGVIEFFVEKGVKLNRLKTK